MHNIFRMCRAHLSWKCGSHWTHMDTEAAPFFLSDAPLFLLSAPQTPFKWICSPRSFNPKPQWLSEEQGGTPRSRAGKVLKHTHQSQLLCAELYNMLDWPLKSINLNQYFFSHLPSLLLYDFHLTICFYSLPLWIPSLVSVFIFLF